MEKENIYGKHVYQSIPNKGRIIAFGVFLVLALIFSILLVMLSVFMIFHNNISAGISFLVISLPFLIFIVYMLAKKKMIQHTINVYEHGITLSRASEVFEFDFKDLDGISTFLVGTHFRGIDLDIWKTSIVVIYPSQSKPIGINARNMEEVSNYLGETYNNYVISSLTKENIISKTIKFGKYIELSDGKMIHNSYKKEIPLESIVGIGRRKGKFLLEGENDSFPLKDLHFMNFDILHHIIYEMED